MRESSPISLIFKLYHKTLKEIFPPSCWVDMALLDCGVYTPNLLESGPLTLFYMV